MSKDTVEIRRVVHQESGEVFVCAADFKDWCHELVFKFNEVTADVDTDAELVARGVRVAFGTMLDELDKIQTKGV